MRLVMAEENRVGSGFTAGELQFANFWVRNRILLRKIGYGTLIAINAGFWLFAIWGLLDAMPSLIRGSRAFRPI